MAKETQYVDAVGKFLCTVKRPGNGWLDETKSGTPFVRIPCIVSEPGDQEHKEIVWRGYLSEKAKPRTVETLIQAFDWDGNWNDLNFDGIQCMIVTEAEEYNGETRIKARWLNRLSNKAADEVAARIAARMIAEDEGKPVPEDTSKAKAEAAKSKAMGSKPSEKEEELEDDDIPF
jgi:hypothetical protein